MKSAMVCLVIVAAFGTLAGCTEQALMSRTAKTDDVLVAVTNPEQRRLWKDAIDAGTLPPLSAIEVPSEPVGTVAVGPVAQAETPKAPTIPESVTTTVLPVAIPDQAGFVGRARVVEVSRDRIRLELENGQPLDIAYRSPSRAVVGGLAANETAAVEIAPIEELGPALRYNVAIGGVRGGVSLVALQESGNQLIARDYKIEALKIRQLLNTAELRRLAEDPKDIPSGGQPLPVEVSLEGRTFTLSPGNIAGPTETGLAYEIVVFDSRMHSPDAAWSDTPPFSLHVAIFAVKDG